MKGWHKESYRHYLAGKGIKTNRYMARAAPLPSILSNITLPPKTPSFKSYDPDIMEESKLTEEYLKKNVPLAKEKALDMDDEDYIEREKLIEAISERYIAAEKLQDKINAVQDKIDSMSAKDRYKKPGMHSFSIRDGKYEAKAPFEKTKEYQDLLDEQMSYARQWKNKVGEAVVLKGKIAMLNDKLGLDAGLLSKYAVERIRPVKLRIGKSVVITPVLTEKQVKPSKGSKRKAATLGSTADIESIEDKTYSSPTKILKD